MLKVKQSLSICSGALNRLLIILLISELEIVGVEGHENSKQPHSTNVVKVGFLAHDERLNNLEGKDHYCFDKSINTEGLRVTFKLKSKY